MNIKKEVIPLPLLHAFKLVLNALLTPTNIDRTWGEEPTCDWTVWYWFQKFFGGDMSLENVEDRNV